MADTITERGGYTFRTTEQGARSITAPNGTVITDDGSDKFQTAWSWCAVELPPGTKYGHVWNPEPTNLDDLSIQFVDDERAPNRTKHANKDFTEWLATADLAGDETPFELRKAWKEGRRKPVKVARSRVADPKG
jgi:hypothetical protein